MKIIKKNVDEPNRQEKSNKEKVNLLGKYEINLRTNLSIFQCAG